MEVDCTSGLPELSYDFSGYNDQQCVVAIAMEVIKFSTCRVRFYFQTFHLFISGSTKKKKKRAEKQMKHKPKKKHSLVNMTVFVVVVERKVSL